MFPLLLHIVSFKVNNTHIFLSEVNAKNPSRQQVVEQATRWQIRSAESCWKLMKRFLHDQIHFLVHSICLDTDAIRVQQKAVEEFSELSSLLTNEYLCHVKLQSGNALDRSDEAWLVFYGS